MKKKNLAKSSREPMKNLLKYQCANEGKTSEITRGNWKEANRVTAEALVNPTAAGTKMRDELTAYLNKTIKRLYKVDCFVDMSITYHCSKAEIMKLHKSLKKKVGK